MYSIYDVGLPVVLILTYQAGIVADWTPWSACSKPCDVGIQSRTRLYDGENRTEEQYCNLQYCPDKGVSCFGGRLSCTQFSGYADCLDGVCICTLGRNNYSKYYNTQNCFPEVGNCIIRENPPFALAKVETLNFGYKLRSCVTNDNPNYEVHVIGVYERNSYNVIIRPRGETDKPIILVLLSYHIVTWNIDTSVPIDSIVYSILRNDSYQLVVVLEKSKCGSAKIIRFNDLPYTTGSDTGGGNTPKLLLTLANFYGPVTSFNGVYTLYSPATIRLEVGGNPLLLKMNTEFKDHVWSCNKVSPQYSNMAFTGTVVPPEVTTANNMFSNNSDWTAWSVCSKPCDVGIQSRTRLYDGENRTEEQYCNLQYCPDKSVSCYGGRFSCTQFGGYADCIDGQCVCTLGRAYYGSTTSYKEYYNSQNCFPEVGNCIIRENPPFALAKVETLNFGYKLRSCVTNDNPNYEVHVIGVYERNSYDVIIRPRGETDKPIILVLLSYHIVTWNIDTSVPIDSIVYSIFRSDTYQPVVVLEKSKCGSAKIIRFNDLRYTTGSDTGGGNTPKILLTLANFYGPVTSFNGVYTLYSPATIRLEVGGNPLLLKTNTEFKDHVWSCNKVSPQYSNMAFTGTVVPPEVTTANNMFSNNSDWTAWSACSKPCDVGIQSRTRLYDGESRTEEQYCNLQYCPDKGVSCYGGRFSCTQFGGYADCIDGQCVCTLGRAYYGSTTSYREYYNSQNCFPEVGNCIIRENPPFALAKVETLNFGYKLRSCVTNDNPNYEVHVIGVYESNSYDVIIRPRGGTDKPIILVLLSYHIVTWNIDTSVPIDSIVYSILRSDSYQPVVVLEKSKCGSAKIIRFNDLPYTTGSDSGGGNTPKILLTLANFYGPVTSFNGVYTLYSPATIRLEVGGNPLLLKTNTEFKKSILSTMQRDPFWKQLKDYDWSCRKVSPQYSNMIFTGTVVPPVRPEVTTADNMFTSSSSIAVILPTVIACAVVITVICIIVVIAIKRKRANLRYIECAAPQRIIIGALPSYAVPPASHSGPPSESVPVDGWSSNIDSISTHEMSRNTADTPMDAPPSYESVAGMNGQLVTPCGPSLMESARSVPSGDSTLNTNTDNSQTEPRNNYTTMHHAPMAAQTNFSPSTSSPPTYESYIAMQYRIKVLKVLTRVDAT
ncbi:uncharacterized protein [Magallana gigas]|uniref:uncharacterized protein isoform X1 n=1 Tax=Magallana gigas TaxID=29159 RepID=UPI00333E7E01